MLCTTVDPIKRSKELEESSLDFPQAIIDGEIQYEDDIAELWNPLLYSLQSRSPKSRMVPVGNEVDDKPPQFGMEYHGLLSKAEAIELLLDMKDGCYLVRQTTSGRYIISFKFNSDVLHYTIKWNGSHFIYDEKEFDSIAKLMDDTLITLFVQKYDISQHLTLGREKQQNRQASRLKRKYGHRYTMEDRQRLREIRLSRTSNDFDWTDGESSVEFKTLNEDSVSVLVCNATNSSLSTNGILHDADKFVNSPVPKCNETVSNNDDFVPKTEFKFGRKKGYKKRLPQTWNSDRNSKPFGDNNFLSIPRTLTEGSAMSKEKSVSTGNLVDADSALNKLIKSTLTLGSDEDLLSLNKRQSASLPTSRCSSTSSYGKTHNFKVTTYKGPCWCEICHHFLWGLVQQGMRCQDCGINVHKQCLSHAMETDCMPTKKMVKRVFGTDLTTVVLLDEKTVPSFLSMCITELESNALDTEGLYRVPGQTSHILELKEKANHDELTHQDLSDILVVHVITGAIKLFLRELPIPLIPYDAYPHLMEFMKDSNHDVMELKQILKDRFPKAHYDTLCYLLHHLSRVAENSDLNKMQSSNLAVVFAPTIMRSAEDDEDLLSQLPLQKKLVELLINKCHILFDE